MDFDGSYEYSTIKTATLRPGNEQTRSQLAVYPNPISGEVLRYRFTSADQPAERLQVINARGEVVHQQPVAGEGRQQEGRISVADLQPGVYLIQVVGRNTTIQQRFIKQ